VTDFLANDVLGRAKRKQSVADLLDAASENLEGKFKDAPLVEASIRTTLGRTYGELGKYKDAELHMVRALEIHQEQLGEEDPATLNSMHSLGVLYCNYLRRYDQAEGLFVKVLDIERQRLGEEDQATLHSLYNLGVVYFNQRRYVEAEPLFINALEGLRRLVGEEHTETVACVEHLIELYEAWGKPEKAEQWRAKLPRKEDSEKRGGK
jgi:tetratricopeptide (TPR) repeat protein